MGNLSSIANTTSGLRAAQAGLFVTGHNMANVNTQGFSRQRVMQQDFAYRGAGSNHFGVNQIGLGTDVTGITQIRDRFLDTQFREERGKANFFDRLHKAGTDIELAMGELRNPNSSQNAIRILWASIHEFNLNPSGIDSRSNFISATRSYLNSINDTHRRLLEQQAVLNREVKGMVDNANELVDIINQLNRSISAAEISGQKANDLRDQRNLALDQLSALIDISYREDGNGIISITSNGHQLLANGIQSNIGLRYTAPGSSFVEPVMTSSKSILPYDPTYSNAHSLFSFNGASRNNTGALKATIMARGLHPANHSSLNMERPNPADFENDPNGFRQAMETFRRNEFNAVHSTISRTMRHLDTLFNHKVTMMNEHLTQGYDLNGNPGVPLFVRINQDDDYSLGNVTINPVLLSTNGYNYLGVSLTPTSGRDDGSILTNLLEAWEEQNISLDGSAYMNIEELHVHIVTVLATETARVRNMAETHESIVNDVDSRRIQMFGVSLDEEMTNMIQFQHAFNAASRMVNTLDSMIETLIRGTGRAGL